MMPDLPDAPWIQKAERFGEPDEPLAICPICGEEAETFYVDRGGDVVGCEYCIRNVDVDAYKTNR